MKTLFTLLLAASIATGFTQSPRAWVAPLPSPKNYCQDTLINELVRERRKTISKQKQREEMLRKLILPPKNLPFIDTMPNAITLPSLPPVYDGNNGRGFDIYRSQVDNMPILMPDSANAATLKKMRNDRKIYPRIIQPKIIISTPKNQ